MTGADQLRVGDSERTRVTETLHDHFAHGRLTRDELDERLEATLSAKTFGDLRKVMLDLPGPGAAEPSAAAARPVSGPGYIRRPRLRFLPLVVGVLLVALLLSSGPLWATFGLLKVIFVTWLVLGLLGFMRARRWRRHGPWQGRWQGPYGPYPHEGPGPRRGPRAW